ncbi:MAG TPA: HXXEE domain-containing protein [Flavipsychrobacter sp.]|nr:HXXEE domain-containing protein [Flavipsychrobacter sp.]
MQFVRRHWYDLGIFIAIALTACLALTYSSLTTYEILLWMNAIALFLHQFEEYRFPGTFPGMINTVLFKSATPDRYPLNPNTALGINVVVGWGTYLLAAILAEKAIWLGIAVILVSLGNFIAHTFLFNIKGKTFYNAGMLTSWVFFAPLVCLFFYHLYANHLASSADYVVGILLGIALNVFGVLKPITWLADRNTKYVFPQRNLLAVHQSSL